MPDPRGLLGDILYYPGHGWSRQMRETILGLFSGFLGACASDLVGGLDGLFYPHFTFSLRQHSRHARQGVPDALH